MSVKRFPCRLKFEKKIVGGFVLKHVNTNYCVVIVSIEGSHEAPVARGGSHKVHAL